jgi:hypothetical protein
MKATYKYWMWINLVCLAIVISWDVILLAIDHESKFPFDIYFTIQAMLSIALWVLISKRLFIPAFYFACAVVVVTTFNLYKVVVAQNISHLSTTVNDIYHYGAYFGIAIFCLTLFGILAYYPYRVMKTAKKLGLA